MIRNDSHVMNPVGRTTVKQDRQRVCVRTCVCSCVSNKCVQTRERVAMTWCIFKLPLLRGIAVHLSGELNTNIR